MVMGWFKRSQTSDSLESIVNKWTQQGITLYVYEKGNKIILDSIIVPPKQRRGGIGTQIMKEITEYADRIGKRVELSPGQKDDYHGTTSRKRLVDFYKRFGLIENKGRRKDFTTTKTMYREPLSSSHKNWYAKIAQIDTPEEKIDQPSPPPFPVNPPKEEKKIHPRVYNEGDPIIRNGEPVTLTYTRNKNKAPDMGSRFAQDIEPGGEYMNYHNTNWGQLGGLEYGTITFNKPFVLEHKTTAHGGWKTDLSNMYGGKTGKALTQAIKQDGYDGIITIKDFQNRGQTVTITQEIVNLGGVKS
jgi:predicted GNAT family acetyltransferase